ncbi:MAG: hypothetical protein ACRCZD_12315 [Phycicoccus sp.]
MLDGTLTLMGFYQYTNLTNALKDKGSPLRQYLDERFSNVGPLRNEYRAHAGRLVVEAGDAAPGTLGAAVDFHIRLALDPTETPLVAELAFTGRSAAAISTVCRRATAAAQRDPLHETVARACWALALCTEVYRVGGVMPGSPLGHLLAERRFTADALLALAPADALRQMHEMGQLAAGALLPQLGRPLHLGPTFDGSSLCSADADLIADGLLLDIKTRLGSTNARSGERYDNLPLLDIYQVLAYALFDYSDTYRITKVGIYSARYGTLVTWPISDTLETLAGEPVDLARERSVVWRLLGGDVNR